MEAIRKNAKPSVQNEALPHGVVHKYGGSSVATIDMIKAVAACVAEVWRSGTPIAVVVSAMGSTTDDLIRLARETGGADSEREMDQLLSTGEQQTVALLAMALQAQGVNAVSLTGAQCGFRTNGNHSRARITDIGGDAAVRCILDGGVPVVAGFQGTGPNGSVTTLGRGGSDTTAVALAARLGWDCEIYTDVDRVHTADPRKIKNAKGVSHISPADMAELSCAGAGVLENRSVELAGKYGVKLFLGRSLERDKSKGTYIMEDKGAFESMPVTGVGRKDCSIVSVRGAYAGGDALMALYGLLADMDIRADMLTVNTEGDFFTMGFVCSPSDGERFIARLGEAHPGLSCRVSDTHDRVTLVGSGLSTHSDMGLRAFAAIRRAGAVCLRAAASGTALSYVVERGHGDAAVQALSEEFDLVLKN